MIVTTANLRPIFIALVLGAVAANSTSGSVLLGADQDHI